MPDSMHSRERAKKALENSRRYGVTENHHLKDMLPRHRDILRRTVLSIYQIGETEAARENNVRFGENARAAEAKYLADIHRREPAFTFLIDGPRGSGKTSITLTIRHFAELLGARGVKKLHDFDEETLTDISKIFDTEKDIKPLQPLVVSMRPRRVVHALPLVRPDNMETTETVMEGVFAEMALRLVAVESNETLPEERRRAAETLRHKLHSEVAKGWYFSRQLGVEALLNDSLNFHEYIERRSNESAASHSRIKGWRDFVVEYLDFFNAQLLGVFIDDTDISNAITVDVLHCIRMFFCHPRIVAVIAGNLHTMRQRLLMSAMEKVAKASMALRGPNSFTASFWRNFERENVEEYLEKVFPRPTRHFIRIGGREVRGLLNEKVFSQFCAEQMQRRLEGFLRCRADTRKSTHDELPKSNVVMTMNDRAANEIENYLALWLLKNHYCKALTPKSARHLNQFRDMVARDGLAGAGNSHSNGAERRVVVALFTEPQNFHVVQRFTDRDWSVMEWLSRQTVSSAWRGARKMQINELILTSDLPAYDYLLFRIDLEFAMPSSPGRSADFPGDLLPRPAGRNIWVPEVWETRSWKKQSEFISKVGAIRLQDGVLRLQQEGSGLTRSLSSPVIPANCLYFKDFRGLPEVLWAPDRNEPHETLRWGILPVQNIETLFRLDRYDFRNAYFRDVIMMFGSFPLLPPIPAKEFTQEEFDLLACERIALDKQEDTKAPPPADDTGEKQAEARISAFRTVFANSPFFKDMRELLAEKYRAAVLDAHNKSGAATKLDSAGFSVHVLAQKLRDKHKDEHRATPEFRVYQQALAIFSSNVIPRYHCILNDVRRAYAALRIFEHDLIDYENARGSGKKSRPFIHNRNDRLRLVGLNKLRAVLGLKLVVENLNVKHDPAHAFQDRDWRYYYVAAKPKREDGPPWSDVIVACADKTPDGFVRERTEIKFGNQRLELPAWDTDNDDERDFLSWIDKQFRNTIPNDMEREEKIAGLLSSILDTRVTKSEPHAPRAHLMRSVLLFLWGIGPCLSSLIHLEIVGALYKWRCEESEHSGESADETGIKCADRMLQRVEHWGTTINYAIAFVILFACSMEQNLSRQLDLVPQTDKPEEQNANASPLAGELFSPFPDFSISSLGLRLFRNETRAPSDPFNLQHGFDGVVGDTLLRLLLALGYLRDLKEWIAELRKERQDRNSQ